MKLFGRCVAVCCSVLQCVAVCCSVLHIAGACMPFRGLLSFFVSLICRFKLGLCLVWFHVTGWLQLVGSLKLYLSLENVGLFCRALLQKRPIILRSLLIVATCVS